MNQFLKDTASSIKKTRAPYVLFALMVIFLFLALSFPGRTFLSTLFLVLFILCSGLVVIVYLEEISAFLRHPGWGGRLNLTAVILLVLGIAILLNIISARQHFKVDMTTSRTYTLSRQSLDILKNIDKPVQIIFFRTQTSLNDQVLDILKLYVKNNRRVELKEYDPEEKPMIAQEYDIKPIEAGDQTLYSTIVILSGVRRERTQGATVYYTQTESGFKENLRASPNLERKITSALLRLKEKPRKVYFLSGHDEADIMDGEKNGISKFRSYLGHENYEVDRLLTATTTKIPEDCSLLICWGPQRNYAEFELRLIAEYLDKGGRIIIAADPQKTGGLNPLMQKWGIALENDIVIDPASAYWYQPAVPFVKDYNDSPLIDNQTGASFFPGASSIRATSLPGLDVNSVIETSAAAWGETDFQMENPTFDKEKDLPGPLTLMATSGKRSEAARDDSSPVISMTVFGDSDFIRNQAVDLFGNLDLCINAINYMADRKELMSIRSKDQGASPLSIGPFWMNFIFYSCVVFIPLLFLVFGIFSLWKRKR